MRRHTVFARERSAHDTLLRGRICLSAATTVGRARLCSATNIAAHPPTASSARPQPAEPGRPMNAASDALPAPTRHRVRNHRSAGRDGESRNAVRAEDKTSVVDCGCGQSRLRQVVRERGGPHCCHAALEFGSYSAAKGYGAARKSSQQRSGIPHDSANACAVDLAAVAGPPPQPPSAVGDRMPVLRPIDAEQPSPVQQRSSASRCGERRLARTPAARAVCRRSRFSPRRLMRWKRGWPRMGRRAMPSSPRPRRAR